MTTSPTSTSDQALREAHYTLRDPFTGKDVQISDEICDRLRGRYACGTTLDNGEPEFGWREFTVPPIQHEAAGIIAALRAEVERLKGQLDEAALARDDAGYLGTVADCIRALSDERDEARASHKHYLDIVQDGILRANEVCLDARDTALAERDALAQELGRTCGEVMTARVERSYLEDRFWLELREPRRVPERKGPWLYGNLAKTLREFMAARPRAYITVVTIGRYGPDFQDGPEALQMADARSMSTGSKHIARTREAHDAARTALGGEP